MLDHQHLVQGRSLGNKYLIPPAALVTAEAAPISVQALAWNQSGSPLRENWGPETAGGAGIIKEDVQKLRGFRSATLTNHHGSHAYMRGCWREEGLSYFPTIFRVLPSQEEQFKSKETDSMKADGNNTRNYAGFLHWNSVSCTKLSTEADAQMLKWGRRVLALDQTQFGGLFIIFWPDETA